VRRCPLLLILYALASPAEDWPEWRGKGRLGVWNESGILDNFPTSGLAIRWRAPVHGGFAGPAVAASRVYVTDFLDGRERLLCLDEKTGKLLWKHEWPASYRGMQGTYAIGPRATPTVDGDRVYALGGSGVLQCLDSRTGKPLWTRDYVRDYGATVPTWGIAGAPLVDGPRLICIAAGRDAKVVALDKLTGREIWRALETDESGPGYSQPVIVRHGGRRQLIVWDPVALQSLDPESGKLLWREPFRVNLATPVATPVQYGDRILVSCFYNGSLMMGLDGTLKWKGKSSSEINTDGLHALINTPVIVGDYIYGICSYGQMRCIRASTGERLWETLEVTKEKARWAAGLTVRQGDRFFINNDRGELILARLSPEAYREIGRTPLIKPTSKPGNRRELGAVNWSHPAYANGHIFARNDEELICASLRK
jgi:outer membrane protein assembly factor BamB